MSHRITGVRVKALGRNYLRSAGSATYPPTTAEIYPTAQNLLVSERNRLLEPASEFVKLAIANIKTRRISDKVVDDWKPVLSNAINEWARQRTLTAVLENPTRSDNQAAAEGPESSRIETTQEELAAFEIVRRHLGPSRPVAYEDTQSYFKIHLAERYTWVMCRLYLGRKRPTVWGPLQPDQVQPMAPDFSINSPQAGWTCITLVASSEIERLGDVLRAAWDSQKAIRHGDDDRAEAEAAEGPNHSVPIASDPASPDG